MYKKINRKECLDQYPIFPQSDNRNEVFFFPKIYRRYVLMLSSKTIKRHAKNLAAEVSDLIEYLKADCLIFLGDTKTPWLYQQNDFESVKSALEHLYENKIGKTFNGGLELSITGLRPFLTHLFWLARCNAAFPNIHFTDKGQQFIGNICKYGNVHLFTLNRKCDSLLKAALKKSGLTILEEEKCSDQFSKMARIKGRQTKGA